VVEFVLRDGGAPGLEETLEHQVPAYAAFGGRKQFGLELLAFVAGVEPRQVALEGLPLVLEVGDEVLEQRLLAAPYQAGGQVELRACDQLVDELGPALLIAGARQVGGDALLDPALDLVP